MQSPLALIHATDRSKTLAQSALPHAPQAATTGAALMRELRVALESQLERVPAGSPEREQIANDLVARVLGPERRVA
jgi:hypothetical protein